MKLVQAVPSYIVPRNPSHEISWVCTERLTAALPAPSSPPRFSAQKALSNFNAFPEIITSKRWRGAFKVSEFQASTMSQKGRYSYFFRQHVIRTAFLRNAVHAHRVLAQEQVHIQTVVI